MRALKDFVQKAIDEDLGRGDLFSKTIDSTLANKNVKALIIAKDDGVFSGNMYFKVLLDMYDIQAKTIADSTIFKKGEILARIQGKYADILAIERVGLNLLQHSSGIATNTHSFAKILQDNHLSTILLDTRKTRPQLRIFEKYSVRNGGGYNHRFGLDDCLMLKDTHLTHITNLYAYIQNARKIIPFGTKIEVECKDINEAKIALESNVDILMCDNMSIEIIKEIVKLRNQSFSGILLEASGNITKENLISYAKTGVDAISSGALIHQAVWIDMSMKML